MLFKGIFVLVSFTAYASGVPFFGSQITSQAPLLSDIGATVIEGSYIIAFKDDVKPEDASYKKHFAAVNSYLAIRGATDESNKITHIYKHALNGYSGIFDESLIEYIRQSPEVKYVEKDQIVKLTTTQTNAPWGLARLSSRTKLTSTNRSKYIYDPNGGKGITAYIVDTGVNVNHVDFEGRAVWGTNVISGEGNTDGNGHGTHVAGTVGSKTYGVAKKVKIVAVKVLNSQGSGSMSGVIKGVDYTVKAALQEKKDAEASGRTVARSVANMSLGGGFSSSLNSAVEAAVGAGVTYVVAAGNENQNACNTSPASAPSAISVGATDINDNRSYFSNWGTCVDIFAPGSSILSTWIGSNTATNTISGTSMASPHVAGLAAYYFSLSPTTTTPAQLTALLNKNATPNIVKNPGTGSPNLLGYNNPPASFNLF